MTLYLANVVAYSLQLAVLVASAFAIAALLRLRTPLPSLRFWQAVLAAALLLPLLQPRPDEGGALIAASATFVAASLPVETLVTRGIDPIAIIVFGIAAGIALRLAWLGLGLLRLRNLIAHATVDTALFPGLTEATLMVSDEIESPATVGLRRPLILVPRRMLAMPAAVQHAVLAHELAHVRRRDWLHTLAEEVWCAVLWFHPAARVVASQLSLARETVVDELTIIATRNRRAYAEALLAFADPQPHLVGVTPLIGRRHLSQRISLIAEEGSMSRRRTLSSLTAALAVSAAATAFAVTVFPMAATAAAQAGKVYEPGQGMTLPTVVREVKPVYTPEAMQKKIQGSVWASVVVGDTGDVTDVRITRSLDPDYGLDREAEKAAWQWKFKPGRVDGKPVAVRVTLELTFTLKADRPR